MAKPEALKRALHVIASLFVPLIMVGLLLLGILLTAIEDREKGLKGRGDNHDSRGVVSWRSVLKRP